MVTWAKRKWMNAQIGHARKRRKRVEAGPAMKLKKKS